MSLTPRLNQCLQIIANGIQGGVCPSYDEIRETMGLASRSGVFRMLNELEERGYIQRLYHRARAIDLTAKAVSALRMTAPEVPDLQHMGLADLETHLMHVMAIHSHRTGIGHTKEVLTRGFSRLAGLPRVPVSAAVAENSTASAMFGGGA